MYNQLCLFKHGRFLVIEYGNFVKVVDGLVNSHKMSVYLNYFFSRILVVNLCKYILYMCNKKNKYFFLQIFIQVMNDHNVYSTILWIK